MNIPPKYEDVVAQLEATLGREAALREELDTVRDLHAKQCCVFCNDTGNLRSAHAALQQRLTVADDQLDDCGNFQQRQIAVINEFSSQVEYLKSLLKRCQPHLPGYAAAVRNDVELALKVDEALEALKPAEEGEGS